MNGYRIRHAERAAGPQRTRCTVFSFDVVNLRRPADSNVRGPAWYVDRARLLCNARASRACSLRHGRASNAVTIRATVTSPGLATIDRTGPVAKLALIRPTARRAVPAVAAAGCPPGPGTWPAKDAMGIGGLPGRDRNVLPLLAIFFL